jgi:hypothetical protein
MAGCDIHVRVLKDSDELLNAFVTPLYSLAEFLWKKWEQPRPGLCICKGIVICIGALETQ